MQMTSLSQKFLFFGLAYLLQEMEPPAILQCDLFVESCFTCNMSMVLAFIRPMRKIHGAEDYCT